MHDRTPSSSYRKLLLSATVLFLVASGLIQLWRLKKPHDRAPAAAKTVDMLPTRARILSETTPESIEQSVDALPSFMDWSLATSIGMDACGNESYCRARLGVPRLNRVRKLLAQIDDSTKPRYTAVLLQKLDECMTGYVESRKEMLAELDRVKVLQMTEPDAYYRKRGTAAPLVYILTEWDRHDALPTFARLLEQPDPIVVNRLFLLYSCHVLLESLPADGLSPDQRAKLGEYKQLAEKIFPPVPRVKVPAWNAKFEENDFRAVILGEHVPVESEPTIELRIYPDLSDLQDVNFFTLRKDAAAVQEAMRAFFHAK